MKNNLQPGSMPRFLLSMGMALILGLALPVGSQAASTTLATAPLATSTTSSVLPNLMFVLDDSGSMAWDYLPDSAKNFAGNYGFNTSHCNGVYYNPNITYTPPLDSNGVSYANSASSSYLLNTFTNAYVDGYKPGSGTSDLDTDFTGGSGSGSSGSSFGGGGGWGGGFGGGNKYTGPAFYYTYTGTQTTAAQMNINNTSGTYYTECSSGTASTLTGAGPIPGNSIFKLTTLSSTETVTLTISKPSNSATSSAQVNSITVNGIGIMSSNTGTQTSTSDLASAIAAKINSSTGFTATNVSGSNVVTITQAGSTTAKGYTPVITTGSGNWIYTTYQFPDTDAVKLQNFANWYTYYSNRMLMMKTGVGLAFSPLDKNYRVGYMTMNNNNWNGTIGSTTADFVDLAPFDAAQKSDWYSKLYVAKPGNSTPLRGALSNVGRLYAKKYAPTTIYTATITITDPNSASGATTVSSITVNGVELMGGNTATSSYKNSRGKTRDSISALADSIGSAINSPAVSDYGASVGGSNGNVVTITGPASASGASPVITYSGGYVPVATSFVETVIPASLNGIQPKDPIQYSCQQNFVILSTDGYWNGKNTYDLSDPPVNVGNQDGAEARPKYDGASGVTTLTTKYSRTYQTASTSGCPAGQAQITTQPQTRTCTTTISNGTAQPESCPSWANGSSTTSACSIASVQSPNPSNPQVISQTTTSSTSGGTSNTLADVAMYYYKTDLRTPALNNCDGAFGTVADTGIDVCPNNVAKTDVDNNTAQHMSTFTLGLGASGKMQYSPTYQNDSSGDYYSVANGVTAHPSASPPVCAWQSNNTTCNWPTPTSGQSTTIDDLWHAAVDGGGTYFSATDPSSLASGLAGALASIASRTGSSAAAATSTLNPVAGNNYAYVASYTTVKWQGNLESRTINVNTGVVSTTPSWCVENIVAGTCPSPGAIVADSSGSSTTYSCVTTNSTASTCASPGVFDGNTNQCSFPMGTACIGTMPSLIGANSDTRTIYTANSGSTALTPFLYANLTPGQQADFTSPYINGLSQWGSMTATQQTAAQGANLVNYLRGQYGYDSRSANYVPPIDKRLFRYREATMGDALESQPNYIGKPVFNYADPGYSAFATAQSSRSGTVYIGTNDGMLHAFSALTQGAVLGGTERWAYVPSMVIPNMWKLADTNYANLHTNYVNGSPVISDVCTANCTDSATAVWRTILVGGLNEGGRGYYALDITNPSSPSLLWEFTTTAGQGSTKDDDMGYSYGNPVITAKADGTWVVLLTSGYNNINPGSGQGFLYVLNAGTGAIISKIATGAGDTTTPSGLSKISAWNDVPSSNRATYVYGGDLLGNVWRFDINSTATAAIGTGDVLDFATLDDPSGNPQPITTSPVLGKISGYRVIFIGTGQYLGTPDLSTSQVQSEYAIKDDNATATLVNPGGSPRNSSTLVQQTLTTANGVRTATNYPVDFTTGRGWYIDFPDSGERVNIDGKLVQGTLLVATIVPSNTVCAPGGYGWLNYFNYETGSSVDTSGVVSSSYSNTIVGINVLYINGTPIIEAVTSNDPTPTVNNNVLIKGNASGFTGQRVLWRELNP
jgi:type IV pilus assembly protein PilY1